MIARGALALLLLSGLACGGEREVATTPETFARAVEQAKGGDRIVLSAGDYGTFTGARKSSRLTIEAPRGVRATMGIDFNPASNLQLKGLTITGLTVRGPSRNITVSDSTFTGQAVVYADQMVDAGIVFARNRHPRIDACADCFEGRMQVSGAGPGVSGVTIRNSVFGPGGCSDGIQITGDATGVRIRNNEFKDLRQDACDAHVDPIQLYGSSRTRIEGNYFHGNSTAIMAPDGGDREVATNNVFVGSDYRDAIQYGSHDAPTFTHNTLVDITMHMNRKVDNPKPTRNAIIRDNVMLRSGINTDQPDDACEGCTISHNLFSSRREADGRGSRVGTPRFVGGDRPSVYKGYRLAKRSPGSDNASDGKDRGITGR